MILILDYGVGNLLSIERAFKFFNVKIKISDNIKDLNDSSHLVLPGVGSFSYAMENIKKKDLKDKINNYANSGRPILGTCLGMQLLLNNSEEFGNFEGLGLITGKVKTLKNLSNNQNLVKLPNIGWQKLKFDNKNKFLFNIDLNDEFYHVHSYYCEIENNLEILSYGKFENNLFPNIIQKKNIFGVQFHPEKSGQSGLKLINNFINLKI
tara:strand:+ start:491 stop:1117 length:627 start_codon:yes stop_codon:yes gene_type:complete